MFIYIYVLYMYCMYFHIFTLHQVTAGEGGRSEVWDPKLMSVLCSPTEHHQPDLYCLGWEWQVRLESSLSLSVCVESYLGIHFNPSHQALTGWCFAKAAPVESVRLEKVFILMKLKLTGCNGRWCVCVCVWKTVTLMRVLALTLMEWVGNYELRSPLSLFLSLSLSLSPFCLSKISHT